MSIPAKALLGHVVLFLSLLPLPAAADWVINEILYDPPGADSGFEYVELYNNSDTPLSTAGLRLVFINGTDPLAPRTIWESTTQIVLSSGAFYLIGEEGVAGADVTTGLSIQNGPDALRLERAESVLDAVAWGDLEEVGEGAPAEDASSTSIGRIPDGSDGDDNATDFHILLESSPGAPNALAQDFSLLDFSFDPPWLPASGAIHLEALFLATGHLSFQESRVQCLLDGAEVAAEWLACARGDTALLRLDMHVEHGEHSLELIWGEPADGQRNALLELCAGPSRVVLNEVLPVPETGKSEWIEIRSIAAHAVDMSSWSLADNSGAIRSLVEVGVLLPDEIILLCQDVEGIHTETPIDSQVRCLPLDGGWLTLNNSPASGERVADQLLLFDERGAVVDHVAWGEDLPAIQGSSLERAWITEQSPSTWLGGAGSSTPGRENHASALSIPLVGLQIGPNPFTPDGDGIDDVLHIALSLSSAAASVAAEIHDLSGDRVCLLPAGQPGILLQQWIWNGTDSRGIPVPMGAYVVSVEISREGSRQWRKLVALGRRP